MASSDKEASKDSIPLDELQHFRGVAQEQSMNTILSAQQRAENTHPDSDSTRDPIYDAIAEAKKQISEKDKIPFGGGIKDGQEVKSASDASASATDSKAGTLGNVISGYAKNIKEAVVGTNDADDKGSNST